MINNKIDGAKVTNSNEKPHIYACVDGSVSSGAVCDYAIWIASVLNQPLNFLHTIEHSPTAAVADLSGSIGLGSSEELLQELATVEQQRNSLLIKKGKLMLQAVKQKALDAGVETVHIQQRHGSLTESLVELEDEIGILVLGIRGEQHEENQSGIGAQLETVVRSLHKPILVVNRDFSQPKKIMLAYDGSDAANKALHLVASSPLAKGIPCHLVHVSEKSGSDKGGADSTLLEQAVKTLQAATIDVVGVSLEGKIENVLTEYQAKENIDLMVMGAFSHNRVRDFLLGSFTASMLASTQRPLLLLR